MIDLLDVDFVSGWVIKDEFREFLFRRFEIAFASDSEFNKFWKRIDLDGFNALRTDTLSRRMAGPIRPFSSPNISTNSKKSVVALSEPLGDSAGKLNANNLNIEKWLKTKFREGFKELQNALKLHDTENNGRINRKAFRQVLGKFGERSKLTKIFIISHFLFLRFSKS